MKKSASAHSSGGIKDGQGSMSTETGTLREAPYGFSSRFEDGPGTNPEELIGAAHAGCYSMALSLELGKSGLTPDRIDTTAIVTLEKDGDGFAITAVHLICNAAVPGADKATFEKIAEATKQGCPVSKVLKATITLDATLIATTGAFQATRWVRMRRRCRTASASLSNSSTEDAQSRQPSVMLCPYTIDWPGRSS
jgi:osmotically inducible protein OsmC